MSLSVMMADQIRLLLPCGLRKGLLRRERGRPASAFGGPGQQVGWRARRDHLRDGLFRDGSFPTPRYTGAPGMAGLRKSM
jgi:hypothetical protein